jgi:hypothetical protein
VNNDILRWFREAIELVPDIAEYRDEVREFLEPLLRQCKSKSKSRFWIWLRQQLAKTEESAEFLQWMQERRTPAELPFKSEVEYTMSDDGSVALIKVGDDDNPAVWRVPAERLQWALDMFPVYLKKLPELQSPTADKLRRLQRKVRREMPFLTQNQRHRFAQEAEELERSIAAEYEQPPRYLLMKSIEGRDVAVHRLFLDAGDLDQVEAIDGDFLNFATTQVQVTVSSVPEDGVGVRKGDRPLSESFVASVPNLMIVNNADQQRKFEVAFQQVKKTPQGDVDESPLRVLPNADLGTRTQCEGKIADCGAFQPLSKEEKAGFGQQSQPGATQPATPKARSSVWGCEAEELVGRARRK